MTLKNNVAIMWGIIMAIFWLAIVLHIGSKIDARIGASEKRERCTPTVEYEIWKIGEESYILLQEKVTKKCKIKRKYLSTDGWFRRKNSGYAIKVYTDMKSVKAALFQMGIYECKFIERSLITKE